MNVRSCLFVVFPLKPSGALASGMRFGAWTLPPCWYQFFLNKFLVCSNPSFCVVLSPNSQTLTLSVKTVSRLLFGGVLNKLCVHTYCGKTFYWKRKMWSHLFHMEKGTEGSLRERVWSLESIAGALFSPLKPAWNSEWVVETQDEDNDLSSVMSRHRPLLRLNYSHNVFWEPP